MTYRATPALAPLLLAIAAVPAMARETAPALGLGAPAVQAALEAATALPAPRTDDRAPSRPARSSAPEWLHALPAPAVPAAHAAGLPMPDALALLLAGVGVAGLAWGAQRVR